MENTLKCPICKIDPVLSGGYSPIDDHIGYYCKCPECGFHVVGSSVSAYDVDFTKEQVIEMHESTKKKAIENWNEKVASIKL